jgi:hypothetical protein
MKTSGSQQSLNTSTEKEDEGEEDIYENKDLSK